jgi:hypothetical protein
MIAIHAEDEKFRVSVTVHVGERNIPGVPCCRIGTVLHAAAA